MGSSSLVDPADRSAVAEQSGKRFRDTVRRRLVKRPVRSARPVAPSSPGLDGRVSGWRSLGRGAAAGRSRPASEEGGRHVSQMAELRTLARPGRRRRGSPEGSLTRNDRAGYLFLAPWLLGLLLIGIGPIVASFVLSFTDYNLLQAPNFVGLDNFVEMWHDKRVWQALRVTFTYVIFGVPPQLAFALVIALLLDRGMRGLAFYRSALYLPSLLGGSVAVAILWRQVFGADGLVNDVLAVFGVEGRSWVSNPATALWTLILLHIWTFGSPMIIFLAGLRQIPDMYYESASIDGAGRLRKFWSITIPLLTPIIFFNLVLQTIYAFQAFTQAYIVSGGQGGPADSTLFFTLYLYKEGFGYLHMGYASAMAWVLLLIIVGVTALHFLFSRFWVFYDD
jgi:multiple sugar transport system permease protein